MQAQFWKRSQACDLSGCGAEQVSSAYHNRQGAGNDLRTGRLVFKFRLITIGIHIRCRHSRSFRSACASATSAHAFSIVAGAGSTSGAASLSVCGKAPSPACIWRPERA
jgi:hypothetical protein